MKFSRKFATAVWEGYFMGACPAIRALKKTAKTNENKLENQQKQRM